MSRIANKPITVPSGVGVNIADGFITVKGGKGVLNQPIESSVEISLDDDKVSVKPSDDLKSSLVMAGTTRAIINNMIIGVDKGFEKKLTLVGVGYRAQMKGKVVNLTLGYSHPIDYKIPDDVSVETPSQTEILVKGCDKQKVGQVSAKIRSFRPPEPYKGKGVRYADEVVVRKEAKKK